MAKSNMNKQEKFVREAQNKAGTGAPWEYDRPQAMQALIDSGAAWKMEGSCGRAAMQALESGACFLPEQASKDYWGSRIPSRNELKEGSKGTLGNAVNFWKNREE